MENKNNYIDDLKNISEKIAERKEEFGNIKSIEILDKDNFIKTLKNKFENLDKLFEVFKETVGKNKWTKIPNKNLYFNKEIMACYPNFLNNFQEIKISTAENYRTALKLIKENEEYNKYKIDWDIPVFNEISKSFGEAHPMESDYNNHWIKGNSSYIYTYENKLLEAHYNRWSYHFNVSGEEGIRVYALLIPIYRLHIPNNFVFPYSNEKIFKIFLEKELIIDKIYYNNNLKKSFEDLSSSFKEYKNFIKDLKKVGNNLEIVWDFDGIIKEIIKNQDKNRLFKEIKMEITYSNNDKEIKNYEFGKENGKSTYIFSNGDKEEFSYNNGVREGERKFTYKNGDSELARYSNGKIQGNSTYLFNNGDKEEFSYNNGIREGERKFIYKNGDSELARYSNGKIQGESKLIYKNEDIETRYYKDGVIQGEATLKNSFGETISIFSYKNGEKKDITKLSNLLNVDKIRVNLDRYDKNILTDPNVGHWDLYENKIDNSLDFEGEKIYARNPRLDIKKGGIVGIDFGTKSTVVVFQDDRNITLPMRISGNILNKAVENSDYENPTVIEFRNINNFIKDYTERKGRPFTKWEDITVSHTAFQNLVNGNEKSFYSIVSELKQWAGSKKDKLLIKDKKGIEKLLNPYLELKENEIDPIEIYAYYIGSYINNMRNGIYLEYFLSFPVTYEKAIREKILASFERGIKKSLPKVILEDENIMKKFKVRHGANEPAAYSICALQEYGFDPEDDEKIYYGVFDFGGGTLDFDFGIFREAEDDRYDYELEHFGAGGDRYLGGENILKELAFETFKENINSLREKGVTFTRPEWCNRFIGDETLVDKNGNSRLNTKLLMEKLRGIWEGTEEITEPKIKLNLFDKSGEPLAGFELSINVENLKNIISNKIEGGIKNFFIAMEKAFKNDEPKKIYILLAGNSSKHPLVKTLFENYIKEKNIDIEILPALGTEEAYKKLEERKISFDKEDKTKPTGKTGVAYGLLESTADSCIKIINRDEEHNKEINFKYYVGTEKKKKLKPILNPNIDYNDFKLFSYVKSDVFNIYYTTLPEASEGNFLIKDAKRIRIPLNSEYDSDTQIYIKATGADTIEYAITKKDINEKDYIENGKITLD